MPSARSRIANISSSDFETSGITFRGNNSRTRAKAIPQIPSKIAREESIILRISMSCVIASQDKKHKWMTGMTGLRAFLQRSDLKCAKVGCTRQNHTFAMPTQHVTSRTCKWGVPLGDSANHPAVGNIARRKYRSFKVLQQHVKQIANY
jgi:hypothetical protein